MKVKSVSSLVIAGMVVLAPVALYANDDVETLRAEMAAMRAEMAATRAELEAVRTEVVQLRTSNGDTANEGDTWMDQRRSEDIRALVNEALADANGRRWTNGVTGGHDGRSFFLASSDNAFRLNIRGRLQIRYMANSREDPDEGFGTTTGFQHRRTKLYFSGHVFDPRITFLIEPEVRRNDGRFEIGDAFLGYALADGLTLQGGRFTAPFLKEDLHSSSRQLAVEPSLTNAIFRSGKSTGVQVAYRHDNLRAYAMVNNGFRTGLHDFSDDLDNSAARIGLTGRVEYRLAGDWGQYRYFAGYSGDPFGLILGGAAHWEQNRTPLGGRWRDTNDFVTWTTDASLYMEHISLFGAFVGRHATRTDHDAEKFNDYALVVQGGYTIDDKFQPFARWEWIMPDNRRDNHDVRLLTTGLNYFIHGHNVKLTTDVVWAMDSLSGFAGGSDALGLLPDSPDEKNQVVWRTQFQLLF